MKKNYIVILALLLAIQAKAFEPTAELFVYDENKVQQEFAQLNELEQFIKLNPDAGTKEILALFPALESVFNNKILEPYSQLEITAPGKIPSFWFTFTLSAIGTYFIYGVVAGPISVGIVYFSTDKNKIETKKALWGCVTGTLLGAGIKYALLNL